VIVSPRVSQLFAIVNRKKVTQHYLVTSDYYENNMACPALHHRVICFETGEDMSLSEEYLNMAERSGWRQT
jgi:hypothetical protein